jgi:hypothetical protein
VGPGEMLQATRAIEAVDAAEASFRVHGMRVFRG